MKYKKYIENLKARQAAYDRLPSGGTDHHTKANNTRPGSEKK